jgi:hypothetical protein
MEPLASLAASSWTAAVGARLLQPVADGFGRFAASLAAGDAPAGETAQKSPWADLKSVAAGIVSALAKAGIRASEAVFEITWSRTGELLVASANPQQALAIRQALTANPHLRAMLEDIRNRDPAGANSLHWQAGQLTIDGHPETIV